MAASSSGVAIDRDKVLETAQALVDKKRFDKAIVEYQKLLAADPKDARVLLKLGETQLAAGQFEPAIATLEQVAQLHKSQGFALKAVAVYQQARSVVQRNVPHLTERFSYLVPRMAELFVELRRTNEAIQLYEEAAARLEAAGRHLDVADTLKKISDLDPQNPDRALRLADALMRVGDTESAVAPLTVGAEGLAARGQIDDALAIAERALTVRPDAKLARLAAGLYLNRGGPKDGAAAFHKIQILFRQTPKDLDVLGLLARALYVLRQPDKAIEVHKEAARIALESGRMDAFDMHMETLVARAPNDAGVRKLATSWSKAPPGLLEPVAQPRLPQPPPRPMPPLPAPPAPPGPPLAPPFAAPMPSSPPMPPPPPLARQMTPAPYVVAPAERPSPARGKVYELDDEDAGELDPELTGMPEREEPTPPPMAAPLAAPIAPPFAAPIAPPPGMPPRPPLPPPPQVRPAPPPPPPLARQMTPRPMEPPKAPPFTAPIAPPFAAPIAPPFAAPIAPPFAAPIARPLAPPIPEIPAIEPEIPEIPPLEPELPEAAPPLPDLDLGALDEPLPPLAPSAPPPADEPVPSSLAGRARFDEEAMEEIEFFVSQGMYEDAINLIDEQLARLPNHPLLLDRRREVEAMASGAPAGDL